MSEKVGGPMTVTRSQPTPFAGAHLSVPKWASSQGSGGQCEKRGVSRILGLGAPNVLGQAPGGAAGEGATLKQTPSSQETQLPRLPLLWWHTTGLPARGPEPVGGSARLLGPRFSLLP